MKKSVLTSILAIAFFAGCGDPSVKSAKVIDSAVSGLEVECAGSVKYTPTDGSVECLHMPLGLKLGEIKLGIVYDMPEDGIILPQDIVNVPRANITDKNVVKLLVLLQSLDKDHNPDNGIEITKETRDKLNTFIDLEQTSLADIKDLVEAQLGETVFKNKKDAIEHLEKSMKQYNISYPNVDLEGLE